MTIAKISGAGLATIGVTVTLLWGCLIGERVIINRANVEMARTLSEVRLMRARRVSQPVSVPARLQRSARPAVG